MVKDFLALGPIPNYASLLAILFYFNHVCHFHGAVINANVGNQLLFIFNNKNNIYI